MAIEYGPTTIMDDLIFCIDRDNSKSYNPSSGWRDLITGNESGSTTSINAPFKSDIGNITWEFWITFTNQVIFPGFVPISSGSGKEGIMFLRTFYGTSEEKHIISFENTNFFYDSGYVFEDLESIRFGLVQRDDLVLIYINENIVFSGDYDYLFDGSVISLDLLTEGANTSTINRVLIYDRGLSHQEMIQNYQNIKDRYGIS